MEEDDVTDWEQAEVGGAFPGLAEAALGALGELAENCGSALLPYLDPLLAAVLDLTQFPQSEVRGAAYEALGSLCCCGRDAQTDRLPEIAPGRRRRGGGGAAPVQTSLIPVPPSLSQITPSSLQFIPV
ncbi:PREDICTED: importin-4 [Ficedula albicollis]|uniref:importin-4 n=1 Tax=Ficedula albicollis TaxID=59894 RepID=UPI0007AD8369|nr:PREDICTED: importin-4 [Ficedula albicollis]